MPHQTPVQPEGAVFFFSSATLVFLPIALGAIPLSVPFPHHPRHADDRDEGFTVSSSAIETPVGAFRFR